MGSRTLHDTQRPCAVSEYLPIHWRSLDGVPPEVLLVPLAGHTLGHAGVAVERTGAHLRNQQRLRVLEHEHGKAVGIISSHDVFEFEGTTHRSTRLCPAGTRLNISREYLMPAGTISFTNDSFFPRAQGSAIFSRRTAHDVVTVRGSRYTAQSATLYLARIGRQADQQAG